jgi:hypothetical protein
MTLDCAGFSHFASGPSVHRIQLGGLESCAAAAVAQWLECTGICPVVPGSIPGLDFKHPTANNSTPQTAENCNQESILQADTEVWKKS